MKGPRVNVNVERGSTFTFTGDLLYIVCFIYAHKNLRAYARKTYATVEIHVRKEFALPQTLSRLFHLVSFVKCWQFS